MSRFSTQSRRSPEHPSPIPKFQAGHCLLRRQRDSLAHHLESQHGHLRSQSQRQWRCSHPRHPQLQKRSDTSPPELPEFPAEMLTAAPERSSTSPPMLAWPSPALNRTSPALPLTVLPASSTIAPPGPAPASPTDSTIDPLSPALARPVCTKISPELPGPPRLPLKEHRISGHE